MKLKTYEFLFIFMIVGIFLISLGTAATDTRVVDDVFKLNEEINYAKPCFNNGTYCSDSAQCNFTVQKPDNTYLIEKINGTRKNGNYNVSFYVSQLGIHKVDITCVDSGQTGAETFYFDVTGSGFNESIAFYVIILLISFGLIVLGFSIKDAWVTVLGSFGLYFIGLYTLFNGVAGIKDLVTTWAIGIILLGVAAYISIRSLLEILND